MRTFTEEQRLRKNQKTAEWARREKTHWNGTELGKVTFYADAAWSRCKVATFGHACALCHRVLSPGELCEKAIFRADRGLYMQLYHTSCALLRQAAGERPEFESPEKVLTWAEDVGCGQCNQRPWECSKMALDCRKCIEFLRLSCVRNDKDEDDEMDL